MISHSYLKEDARVRREGKWLTKNGWDVVAWGLKRTSDPKADLLDGMTVKGINVQRHQGSPLIVYLFEYFHFILAASISVYLHYLRKPFRYIVIHAPPAAFIILFLPLRLTGVHLILDSHEATVELFDLRWGKSFFGKLFRPVLKLLLVVSRACSDLEIVPTESIYNGRVSNRKLPSKIFLLPNLPDDRFKPESIPKRKFMEDGCLKLVYIGAVTPNYDLETAISALALLRKGNQGKSLDAELTIYGRGDRLQKLQDQAKAIGVFQSIRWEDRIPYDIVPGAIAQADIALAPTAQNPATELAFPTKVAEAMAMAIPVVASHLPLLQTYEGIIEFYQAGDPASCEGAIRRVLADPKKREERVRLGGKIRGEWEGYAQKWEEGLKTLFVS